MILADTSVWIDHLRTSDPVLAEMLEGAAVLGHAFVRGELACGNLNRRQEILELLATLPQAMVATDDEVIRLIERRGLMGRGIGYVDAHLLASALLTPGIELWTRDIRLASTAKLFGLAFQPGH